ncbi:10710_t:CDS:2 [Funneliformis geosporum]|uniref:DNA-directed RNA polymerase n=1 Tax=Funneliformis geosporum TaxID=1117311 RepID=A0A9W4WHL8_9GLOM|nr:10710_t:CDS:2 [Funneliformis geosporum]
MVVDKFHARNVGPYSLIYQQPLKGRAQLGGQRVGEMEVWVLEAHGAAWNLMEMMSVKSDDIHQRRLAQSALIFDDRQIDLRSSQSESFNLLLQYLRGIEISFADDNFRIESSKTVNIRTFKPELGGLFDPRIFGPFLNYECFCGKYKGKDNKGQKCERCEVLIAEKNIQRWRMGHISLDTPVTNILLFKVLSTNLSKLLEIPTKKLEDIIYFRAYVVLDNGLTKLLKKKEV